MVMFGTWHIIHGRPHSGPIVQSNLAALLVEVLVYIVSFLLTRDKVVIRCATKSTFCQ